MKKTAIKLISLLLALVFCLCSFGCGGTNDNVSVTSAQESSETEDPSNSFTLKAKYNLVSHSIYKKTPEITQSIMLVKSALAACGIESFITTDSASSADTADIAEYEILIGETSREASVRLSESLKMDDYVYEIVSENVIAICGGSPEATYKAAEKFCIDILGYDTETKNTSPDKAKLTLNAGQSFSHKAEYTHDSLTINGIDIKDFTIAISETQGMILAQRISKKFGGYTGFGIPIVNYSELNGDEKGVICLSAFSRDQSDFFDSHVPGGEVKFTLEDSKITIGIDAYNNEYFNKLIDNFFKTIELKTDSRNANVTLPTDNIEIYDLDAAYGKIPQWILTKETTTTVRDGVTYIEQTYKDENNKPYRAFILKVDPAKASLYMGTTDDEYTSTPEGRQSVLGHMQSAVKNGVDVIAGTNGGFFYISSDYSPIGLSIKEGQVIPHDATSRAFVGFTHDGRMVIGESGDRANTKELRTAIGGRNMIVHKGLPYELEKSNDFGTTSHPRTLAGVMEDGTMILAVVDGRRSSYSNGAPLAVAARFMISLGAVEAVNLDGGGSSTMVIRNGDNYDVKNNPSDGSPRKVFNSLLVIAKDN